MNDRSIVEDLRSDIRSTDRILQMGHEEHISGGVVIVVEGVVVDVGEHRSSSEEGSVGLVEMDAESSDEGEGGKGRVDGSAGGRSGSRRVDCRFGGKGG